jgi:hypothetical protein
MNVFLVIINAEIKFRHYFKLVCEHPPSTSLPMDVLDLMRRTIELVDLIYWKPFPEEGTNGYKMLVANGRINEGPRSNDIDIDDDDDVRTLARRHARMKQLLSADLETRKAYLSSMMNRHGTCLFLFIIAPTPRQFI